MLLTEESTSVETESEQQPGLQAEQQSEQQPDSPQESQSQPEQPPDWAALADPFRLHIESLLAAFSYMVIGVLAGACNLLTELNDMELLSSDRLQRGTAGMVAVIIVLVVWWQSRKSWEYRRKVSGMSIRYLVILAAGALFGALLAGFSISGSREFQNWTESYGLTYAWSYYGRTTDSLKAVIYGSFFTSLASVFFFSFVANYFLPKLNIRAMGFKLPSGKEK